MRRFQLYFNVLSKALRLLQTQVGTVQLWKEFQKLIENKGSTKTSLFNSLWRHSLWEQGLWCVAKIPAMRPI